jgi:hypothetical protein
MGLGANQAAATVICLKGVFDQRSNADQEVRPTVGRYWTLDTVPSVRRRAPNF